MNVDRPVHFHSWKSTTTAIPASLSPAEDAEIENLLANVDAAGEQIQTALSSLSTHLTFIQSQQQQLQSLLNNKRRPMRVTKFK